MHDEQSLSQLALNLLLSGCMFLC